MKDLARTTSLLPLIALWLCGIGIPSAHADITIDVQQVGPDVIWTTSGSVPAITGNLGPDVSVRRSPGVDGASFFRVGARNFADSYTYHSSGYTFTGPTAIGPGGVEVQASSASGKIFGIDFVNQFVWFPEFSSGGAISGTTTYANHTIASLGLTPGTYTWVWADGNNPVDTANVTLNIVPEPASIVLLLPGVIGGLAMLRRRGRSTTQSSFPNDASDKRRCV